MAYFYSQIKLYTLVIFGTYYYLNKYCTRVADPINQSMLDNIVIRVCSKTLHAAGRGRTTQIPYALDAGTSAVASHETRPGIPGAQKFWHALGGPSRAGQGIVAGTGRALPLRLLHQSWHA